VTLSVQSIVHQYRAAVALRAPDFELRDDEHCALVGPSGSGKSTLLGILAGILRPSAGTVCLDGEDLHPPGGRADRWRARHIGMVPQRLHLIESLTAWQNVALACTLAGAPVAPARALLEQLGLRPRAQARPSELSLGEQQRVAIARAAAGRPRLLLADEPTSSLDDDNAERAIALLFDTARRVGALLVVATHDRRIRDRFARVVELERPA